MDENGPSPNTRIEVAAALARGDVPVIPVLVGDSGAPTVDQMPEDVVQLSYRNGISIRSNRSFEGQMQGLIEELEKSVTANRLLTRATLAKRATQLVKTVVGIPKSCRLLV
ncbi:MAG: hypothetical protein ACI9FR_003358 [Cryomorphaceae bacterium]